MASKVCAHESNLAPEDVRERQPSCMLDIMNRHNRLPSFIPLSSLTLLVCVLLTSGIASCGSDNACFYFTKVEYDIGNKCPSRQEALAFFQGSTCSSPIVSVDSDGEFDGSTCCYAVSESNDFFGCSVGPVPPDPFPVDVAATSTGGGFGGSGGFSTSTGSSGGMGGAGGSGDCSTCAEFLTTTSAPPLCTASLSVYEAYSDCMCYGACAMQCDVTCKTQATSMECEECLLRTTNGCGNQQQACLDDN